MGHLYGVDMTGSLAMGIIRYKLINVSESKDYQDVAQNQNDALEEMIELGTDKSLSISGIVDVGTNGNKAWNNVNGSQRAGQLPST